MLRFDRFEGEPVDPGIECPLGHPMALKSRGPWEDYLQEPGHHRDGALGSGASRAARPLKARRSASLLSLAICLASDLGTRGRCLARRWYRGLGVRVREVVRSERSGLGSRSSRGVSILMLQGAIEIAVESCALS
jgi:hypothetical protein